MTYRSRQSYSQKLLIGVNVRLSDEYLDFVEDIEKEFDVTKSEAIRLLLSWGYEYFTKIKERKL